MSSEDAVTILQDSGGENVENKGKKTRGKGEEGLEKVPSSHLEQVDFPAGQVTFYSHLPAWQGPRQVVCQLNKRKCELKLT